MEPAEAFEVVAAILALWHASVVLGEPPTAANRRLALRTGAGAGFALGAAGGLRAGISPLSPGGLYVMGLGTALGAWGASSATELAFV